MGGTCILLLGLQFVVLTFFIKLKWSAIDLPRGPEFLSTALSALDKEHLERLVNKLRKGGFLHQDMPPISALVAEADSRLFSAIETRTDHILSHLFPQKKTKYSLRPRTHEYVLPYKDTRNFIPRFL